LAATYYPTDIRSTGVGWALGIGRVGSIVGPLVGGMMLSRQVGAETLFLAAAVPALFAAAAAFALSRLVEPI
ncbi:MAG TPA: aromatic acid/H+ symport family MFS transporter, partial [Bradyrhizobium sp.]|nr:aromatic acid/H+ symport family MFS transporter [Bradyrhizobium sp.]